MDENPYKSLARARPKIGRLLGLFGCVVLGSIIGGVGGAYLTPLARRQWNAWNGGDAAAVHAWVERDMEIYIRCIVGGFLVGAFCGFAICEIAFRRKVPKN